MKVQDLCYIYESINQDILELKQTRNKVPTDREYTSALQKSINKEIEKFENLKGMVLDLEVEIPANFSTDKILTDFGDSSVYLLP